MATPIKLSFLDSYNPLGEGVHLKNAKEFRDILVAMLVDGIDELGGSLGWTLVLDEATGFVLRNAHPTQPKDYHFYTWDDVTLESETYGLMIRTSDAATGLRTGSGLYPSIVDAVDVNPYGSNDNTTAVPCIVLTSSPSSTHYRGQFYIYATPNNLLILNVPIKSQVTTLCNISSKQSTRMDTEYGDWSGEYGVGATFLGYFTPNGSWGSTSIMLAHGHQYSNSYGSLNPLTYTHPTNTSYSYARSFIQKDSSGNDGYYPVGIRAPRPAYSFSYSNDPGSYDYAYKHAYGLSGLPAISNFDSDNFYLADYYIRGFDEWIGSLPGIKNIGISNVPWSTFSGDSIDVDGTDYDLYRTIGHGSTSSVSYYGPFIGIATNVDWDE